MGYETQLTNFNEGGLVVPISLRLGSWGVSIHQIAEKALSRKPVYRLVSDYAAGSENGRIYPRIGIGRFHKRLWSRINMQGLSCRRRRRCSTLVHHDPLHYT